MLNWAAIRSKPLLWMAGLVTLLANTVILVAPAPWPVTLAALALGLLPGPLFVDGLLARPDDALRNLRDGMERGVYALGAGVCAAGLDDVGAERVARPADDRERAGDL